MSHDINITPEQEKAIIAAIRVAPLLKLLVGLAAFLVTSVFALGMWTNNLFRDVSELKTARAQDREYIQSVDRNGSQALRELRLAETASTSARAEQLGLIYKRLENLERNTAELPALRADLEWFKRSIERQLNQEKR